MKIKRSTAIKNYIKTKSVGNGKLIFTIVFYLTLTSGFIYFIVSLIQKQKKPVAVVQSMNSNPTVTPSKTPDGAPAATPGASTIAPASVSMTPTIVPSSVSTPMSQ